VRWEVERNEGRGEEEEEEEEEEDLSYQPSFARRLLLLLLLLRGIETRSSLLAPIVGRLEGRGRKEGREQAGLSVRQSNVVLVVVGSIAHLKGTLS
jgi:hypothetical protein